VSIWRWIAVVLVAWAAPPIIARTARAISLREKRKKECQHLFGRVKALLDDEFPQGPVESPATPFSWFTDPELGAALITPTVFAYVIPEGKVRKKDLEYVARYGAVVGAVDLRVYTHDPAPLPHDEQVVEGRTVTVRGVANCPCGRGAAAGAARSA
jgi:hypothetical protein